MKSVVLRVKLCEIGGVKPATTTLRSQRPQQAVSDVLSDWAWLSMIAAVLSLFCVGAGRAQAQESLDGKPHGTALLKIARGHAAQGDDFSAADAAEALLREPGLEVPARQEALRLVARGFARYGTPAGWVKVLAASEALLGMAELPQGWRVEALRHGAAASAELREHGRAELYQRALVAEPGVAPLERATVRLDLARSLWAQRAFVECQQLLAHAEVGLSLLTGAADPARRSQLEHLRAERQLLWARCVLEDDWNVRARLLLGEIPTMPGQTPASGPAREAVCLLQRQESVGGPRRIQRVLFIGSSHTIRGNLPALVEQIAASAPPGRVRIVAGERTRMGTGMRGHWNDGTAHDTARGVIASGGWDTVVVETFYRTSREDLLTFASGYLEEARRVGARLLVYETPVAKAIEYPAAYEAHHRTNIWLGDRLGSDVAPCVKAWMGVLGEHPEKGDLENLYADWLHASARGAYLSACCLYAALSGESPEGLWAPPGLLAPDEVLAYQKSAWRAFVETRSELQKTRGSVTGR